MFYNMYGSGDWGVMTGVGHPRTHNQNQHTNQNTHKQVDYWIPDPDVKPIKFKIAVMKPDAQGNLKTFKKVGYG